MPTPKGLLTSGLVSAGHPDKICDQISDAVLDAFLIRDRIVRGARETFLAGQPLIVAEEPRTADASHLVATAPGSAVVLD